MKEYGLPDGPTEHEFPALLARAAEAVVVPHGDAGSVFFRGVQDEVHLLRLPASGFSHRMPGMPASAAGNGDLGVGIHPRADTHDIGTLLVEHIVVPGIPASDAEFIRAARSRPAR